MPYSITEDALDCDGYAVVKDSDGTVVSCHDTQDDAAEQIVAIEANETDMDRANPDDLSTGTRVRWDASGGSAYGRIDTIETNGTIEARPEGPSMEGTEDKPAYLVQVFQPSEDGWEGSDTFVVHRADALTVIESFPESRHLSQSQRAVTSDASIRMASDGERTTVQVMTEDLARDGMIIRADGLDTQSYMNNPVVLWNHGLDPQRGAVPVARTVDMQRVDGGLRATVEWDTDDFSQSIRDKVKRGFLNAVSLGWATDASEVQEIDGRSVPVVTRSDMTEFSFVSVPADAGALVTQRAMPSTADLEAVMERVLNRKIEQLREAATAATPRANSESDATVDGSAKALRDDTHDMTPDDLEQMLDRILNRKLGKA